jgi:hypothetical protein
VSDSPKYCAARLREERERRLREKRERKAEAERAKRKAAEELRRDTRFEKDRQAAQNELGVIQKTLTALSDSENVRFVPADRLETLHARLGDLKIIVQETILEDRLRTVRTDLQAVHEDLQSVVAQAETAKLCADLAAEEAEVVKLERRLAATGAARSEKFDSAGLCELNHLLGSARSHLERKELGQARREATAAQQKLVSHEKTITERFNIWQETKKRAETSLASLGDRIAGLRADEVVVRWVGNELAALEKRYEGALKLAEAEKFEPIPDESTALIEMCEPIVARAQELQLKEDRRQYIVQGIVEVMGQFGFVVQQGYPTLEHPGVPGSATTIQAERIGGGAIAVSVPQEGDIWYDAAGFSMRTETTADGQTVRSCDEAEQEIARMHEAMRDAFGIETSELRWEGKDPDRIRKTAERLPESAPATRTRGE